MPRVSVLSGVAAVALLLSLVVAIASLIRWRRKAGSREMIVLATWALAVQGLLLLELMTGWIHWILNRGQPVFMTSLAQRFADGFGWLFGPLAPTNGRTILGLEIMYLTGSLIFLAGVLALRSITSLSQSKHLRRAVYVQIAHSIEYLMLTLSFIAFGRPQGVSTGFGLLHGEALIAWSVNFHLFAHLCATLMAIIGIGVEFRVTGRRVMKHESRTMTRVGAARFGLIGRAKTEPLGARLLGHIAHFASPE